MGFWDTITDLVEAATPWATADAEAPAQESVCRVHASLCYSRHSPLPSFRSKLAKLPSLARGHGAIPSRTLALIL